MQIPEDIFAKQYKQVFDIMSNLLFLRILLIILIKCFIFYTKIRTYSSITSRKATTTEQETSQVLDGNTSQLGEKISK